MMKILTMTSQREWWKQDGKLEDEGREGECVWVLGTHGTLALQHYFCVCVWERVRGWVKVGALLGPLQHCSRLCVYIFSSPHTTNGSSSLPPTSTPPPTAPHGCHGNTPWVRQRGAYSSVRPLLSSLLLSFFFPTSLLLSLHPSLRPSLHPSL